MFTFFYYNSFYMNNLSINDDRIEFPPSNLLVHNFPNSLDTHNPRKFLFHFFFLLIVGITTFF